MEIVQLLANVRDNAGKAAARKMRRDGQVPAIFYGRGRSSTMVAIDARAFGQKISTQEGAHRIRFDSDEEAVGDRVVLVKDTQVHPVSGAVLHADFYEVDMTRTL